MILQCNEICSFNIHTTLIFKYGASLDKLIRRDVDSEFAGSVYPFSLFSSPI